MGDQLILDDAYITWGDWSSSDFDENSTSIISMGGLCENAYFKVYVMAKCSPKTGTAVYSGDNTVIGWIPTEEDVFFPLVRSDLGLGGFSVSVVNKELNTINPNKLLLKNFTCSFIVNNTALSGSNKTWTYTNSSEKQLSPGNYVNIFYDEDLRKLDTIQTKVKTTSINLKVSFSFDIEIYDTSVGTHEYSIIKLHINSSSKSPVGNFNFTWNKLKTFYYNHTEYNPNNLAYLPHYTLKEKLSLAKGSKSSETGSKIYTASCQNTYFQSDVSGFYPFNKSSWKSTWPINYTFKGWYDSDSNKSSSDTIEIIDGHHYYDEYEGTAGDKKYETVGTIKNMSRIGYYLADNSGNKVNSSGTGNKLYYTSGDKSGQLVNTGDKVTSNFSVQAFWVPATWKVKYDLTDIDRNKIKAIGWYKSVPINNDDISNLKGEIGIDYLTEQEFTYDGSAVINLTGAKPYLLGYEFYNQKGWYLPGDRNNESRVFKSGTSISCNTWFKQKSGSTLPDNVTVYCRLDPIPHYINKYYYTKSGTENVQETYYTIEDTQYNDNTTLKSLPDDNRANGSDFIELAGWWICKSDSSGNLDKPPKYTELKGLYKNSDLFELIKLDPNRETSQFQETPYYLAINKKKRSGDSTYWEFWNNVSRENFRAIYTSTGKKIKIGSQWRKAPLMYIKVPTTSSTGTTTTEWKLVQDLYLKSTDGKWKIENTGG